jgi:hypothetical protein
VSRTSDSIWSRRRREGPSRLSKPLSGSFLVHGSQLLRVASSSTTTCGNQYCFLTTWIARASFDCQSLWRPHDAASLDTMVHKTMVTKPIARTQTFEQDLFNKSGTHTLQMCACSFQPSRRLQYEAVEPILTRTISFHLFCPPSIFIHSAGLR